MAATVGLMREASSPIQIKRADSAQDLNSAVSLIVPHYVSKGYLPADSDQVRRKMLQCLEGHSTFLAMCNALPVATLTFLQGERLPMDVLFQDELDRIRAMRLKVGELGKFAGHFSTTAAWRLMVETVRYAQEQVDVVAMNVHPSHVGNHRRIGGFDLLATDARLHPDVSKSPAVGMFAAVSKVLSQPAAKRYLAQ